MSPILYETFSPQIAVVVSIDNPWGAAPYQRVRARVYVRNNHWLPQMLRVDFKVYTPERMFYSFSERKIVLGGMTVPYTFYFNMPSLPAETRVYLDSALYQVIFGAAKYIHGLTKSMKVSAVPVIMPLRG